MTTENLLQTETEDEILTGSETTDDSGSDLAPEAGEHQSKNSDSVDQEKVNAAINKQHFKYREEERKRLAAEKRAEEAERKLAEQEAKNGTIEIPEMPDPYDENYEVKVKERDDAIRRKAAQDAQNEQMTVQQDENRKAAERAEIDAYNAKAEAYKGRFADLGVKPEEMMQAGEIVASYITDQNLIEYVLDHEQGPLITKYLAAHPTELLELSGMNPIQATVKLQQSIIPAAALLKPKVPGAPNPPDDVSGRGGNEKTSEFIKGAKFE